MYFLDKPTNWKENEIKEDSNQQFSPPGPVYLTTCWAGHREQLGFHAELKGSTADLKKDFLLAYNCIYMARGKMAELVKRKRKHEGFKQIFNISHPAGIRQDFRFCKLTCSFSLTW